MMETQIKLCKEKKTECVVLWKQECTSTNLQKIFFLMHIQKGFIIQGGILLINKGFYKKKAY